MINDFDPKESDNCRSTGCSCCSVDYNIKGQKEEILKEARGNIRVVKEICEYYKIPFSKFCKDILTIKKCKEHKFWKKYPDKAVCWHCDRWKEWIDNEVED